MAYRLLKRLYLLLVIVAIVAGCKKPATSVLVDYQTVRLSPLMFKFVNYSHGCDSYKWDFGDGTWSYASDYALHEFSQLGTYTVTLTGTAEGYKYEYRQVVRVTEPACYIAGFVLYNIPYENQYYKVVFKDDNLFPSSWDFQSGYTPILTEDDLPYVYRFGSPRYMEDLNSHDHYNIQVVRTANASSSDGDKQCLKQQWKVKDIQTYQPEYILSTETDATTVGILMEYAY